MDWSDFFTAIALVMVIEGFVPFLAPGRMKATARIVAEEVPEPALRALGFFLLAGGVLLLGIVRNG